MKRILLMIFILAFSAPHAIAASEVEDAFYNGLGIGSSGWDYGYDEDEEDAEEVARQELEEKEKAEELARKKQKDEDFFSFSVGTYDKQVSRTDKQERKVKGVKMRENNGGRRTN